MKTVHRPQSTNPDRLTPSDVEGSGGTAPTFRRRTDLGNAERFADHASGRLLWVFGQGWLYWDGRRWQRDERKKTEQEAASTVRMIYREAAAINRAAAGATDESEREAWGKQAKQATAWAVQSESRRAIDAMVKLGQSQPRLVLEEGTRGLDADPDALNVANGMIDLKTFELHPHSPEAHHTKLAAADYDPEVRSDLWEGFLATVLPSEDVRRYVQKAAGSALRGRYSEDLFIPWGNGKNGKSTFLRAVRHALGDYAMEAAPELLVRKRGSRNAGDLSAMADLRGRRFVSTIETGQGHQLDETLVKQLTGEHVLKAKFMRQDFFEFENQTSIWLATNHKPRVQGADVAIWERLHLIPFTVYVSPEDRDPELGSKLEQPEHRAAILRWLVDGLRMADAEGLTPPDEVRAATDEYKEEMDPLYDWLDGYCELDPDAVTPVAWLQNSYSAYCGETKTNQMPSRDFNESMASRGLTRPKSPQRVAGKVRKVWQGIRLGDEWMHEAAERLTDGPGSDG